MLTANPKHQLLLLKQLSESESKFTYIFLFDIYVYLNYFNTLNVMKDIIATATRFNKYFI